ncbi:MAG: hypothetical protein RLZZ488_951 [Pseudomonadota bacterium]|jgi:hypothetical protein
MKLKNFLNTFFLLTILFSQSSVYADPISDFDENSEFVRQLGSGSPLRLSKLVERFLFAGVLDYQIGDEWGKKVVDPARRPETDPVYYGAVHATAFFNSATAFYLGRFAGQHVMATNHHVMSSDWECDGRSVNFTARKKRHRCKAFIGSWPEVDLALFTLEGNALVDRDLQDVGRNFDFLDNVSVDLPLLTAGFGIAGNASRQMVVNENDDCRVISGDGEFRLLADPDRYNPADYKAWSFATGCSVSHGDSGSAVFSRLSGKLVGIVWTGAIPKERRVQRSSYLREMQSRRDEEVWSLLTYVVPAEKIAERLRAAILSGELTAEQHAVVLALLGRR